jgi:hypothetical protein
MTGILSATEAVEIAQNSDAKYEELKASTFAAIKNAASLGVRKIYFPVASNQPFYERLKDLLVLHGYKIDRWSSDIWNESIHW